MLTLPHGAFGQPGQPGLSLLITHPHNVQSLSFSYYKIQKINNFNKFIYSTLTLKMKIFSTRGTLTIFTSRQKKQRRKPLPKVVYLYIRSRLPSGANGKQCLNGPREQLNITSRCITHSLQDVGTGLYGQRLNAVQAKHLPSREELYNVVLCYDADSWHRR